MMVEVVKKYELGIRELKSEFFKPIPDDMADSIMMQNSTLKQACIMKDMIPLIREVRLHTGLGLKDAKIAVENFLVAIGVGYRDNNGAFFTCRTSSLV